jgi:nicotinamide mononucleotide transporter
VGILDVDTVAVTVLGYPLSYLELVGTVLYLASVWLIAAQRIVSWPVGIAASVLYALLFHQLRLYADAAEQAYYVLASLYGWWFWQRARSVGAPPTVSRARVLLGVAAGALVLSALLGLLVSRAHLLVPALFPEPAVAPGLDALTTVLSLTAMALTALRRVESWVYWIVVDVIGIGLYWTVGVAFVALLYVVLLGLAVGGLVGWWRATRVTPAVLTPPATSG